MAESSEASCETRVDPLRGVRASVRRAVMHDQAAYFPLDKVRTLARPPTRLTCAVFVRPRVLQRALARQTRQGRGPEVDELVRRVVARRTASTAYSTAPRLYATLDIAEGRATLRVCWDDGGQIHLLEDLDLLRLQSAARGPSSPVKAVFKARLIIWQKLKVAGLDCCAAVSRGAPSCRPRS